MARRVVGVLAALLLVPVASGTWPQFRHDSEHSGLADTVGAILAPHERFTFDVTGGIIASPSVADVAGERLVFFGSYVNLNAPGTLYAVRADGTLKWSLTPLGSAGGYVASPTIAQLDGTGDLELIISSLDDSTLRNINARTGAQIWSRAIGTQSQDLIASSALVADLLPEVPGLEIAIGGSKSADPGNFLIYDKDGTERVSIVLDGPSWSTPLLANIDADPEPELVMGSGLPEAIQTLWPAAKFGGKSLYAFDRSSGSWQIKWTVALAGPTVASPVAGNVDTDSAIEIAIGAETGRMYIVNGATGVVESIRTGLSDIVAISSPVIADVDEDGRQEIVVGTYDGVVSLERSGTSLVVDHWFHLPLIPLPSGATAEPWVLASVALADIDSDGHIDIVGQTVPINVNLEMPLESDALPGMVFAFKGLDFAYPSGLLWSVELPNDGGISSPAVADLDDDGYAEVLAAEGVPLIGDGNTIHAIVPANPIVRQLSFTPAAPTDLEPVTFSAVVTDENTAASALSYAWAFGDGTTSTAVQPSHTFPDDGTFTVQLTVTDPESNAWTRTIAVPVLNVPPTVSPSVDVTPGSLAVTLHADAADADGSVAAVAWAAGDGTPLSGADVSHTYATGGTYSAAVTATDDDGADATAPLVVRVNRNPTLSGPATADATEGQLMQLLLDGADPDGDAIQTVIITGAPSATASIVGDDVQLDWTPGYSDAGLRTLQVRVSDAGSPVGDATLSIDVTVLNTDRAPALAAPLTRLAREGFELSFLVTASDADGDAVAISAVGMPGDATFVDHGDNTGTFSWTPPLASIGSYTVEFVASSLGLETRATTTIEVTAANVPPAFTVPASISTLAPNTIEIVASAGDPDGPDPVTWQVSIAPQVFSPTTTVMPDGSVRWSWQVPSSQTTGTVVTFTASDGEDTFSASTTIDVQLPPEAVFLLPEEVSTGTFSSTVIRGEPTRLYAQAYDADGAIVRANFFPEGMSGPSLPATNHHQIVYDVVTSFTTLGPRMAEFEAADEDGLTTVVRRHIVVVENQPPIVDAGADVAGDSPGPLGMPVTLSGTATDPEGRPLADGAYAWHLPASAGGTVLSGRTVSTSFPVGGHEIELRVTDANGGVGTDIVRVVVDDTIVAEATLDGASHVRPDGTLVFDDPIALVSGDMMGLVRVKNDLAGAVAGASVQGIVQYHGTSSNSEPITVATFEGLTNAAGELTYSYQQVELGAGGLGSPAPPPGRYEITIEVEADSRPQAPGQDLENASTLIRYWVGSDALGAP